MPTEALTQLRLYVLGDKVDEWRRIQHLFAGLVEVGVGDPDGGFELLIKDRQAAEETARALELALPEGEAPQG